MRTIDTNYIKNNSEIYLFSDGTNFTTVLYALTSDLQFNSVSSFISQMQSTQTISKSANGIF